MKKKLNSTAIIPINDTIISATQAIDIDDIILDKCILACENFIQQNTTGFTECENHKIKKQNEQKKEKIKEIERKVFHAYRQVIVQPVSTGANVSNAEESEITKMLNTYGLTEVEWNFILVKSYELTEMISDSNNQYDNDYHDGSNYNDNNNNHEDSDKSNDSDDNNDEIDNDNDNTNDNINQCGIGDNNHLKKSKKSEYKKSKIKHSNLISLLNEIKSYRKQFNLDGLRNFWILKAPDVSQGKGLQISYKLDEILKFEKNRGCRTVQKYIENMLLDFVCEGVEDCRIDMRGDILYENNGNKYDDDNNNCNNNNNNNINCNYDKDNCHDNENNDDNVIDIDKSKHKHKNKIKLSSKFFSAIANAKKFNNLIEIKNDDDNNDNNSSIFNDDDINNTGKEYKNENISKNSNKNSEKYIEKNVKKNEKFKFDIRVWVLVTSFQPGKLQAYIYTAVYGRRCGLPYTTNVQHLGNEYVHLTNYSLQKKLNLNKEREVVERSSIAVEEVVDEDEGRNKGYVRESWREKERQDKSNNQNDHVSSLSSYGHPLVAVRSLRSKSAKLNSRPDPGSADLLMCESQFSML